MSTALQHYTFQGHALSLVEYKGRPAWVAREVGAALGYAGEGARMVDKLRENWGDELTEGTDFVKLTGVEATGALPPDSGGSRIPSLILLFESGLHGVLLLSRQPKAKAMRRWLREEVLPQLARDGRYDPDRAVDAQGQLAPASAAPPPPAADLYGGETLSNITYELLHMLGEPDRDVAIRALLRLHNPGLTLPDPGAVAPVAAKATQREKREKVLAALADPATAALTNAEIGRQMEVSHTYVANLRDHVWTRIQAERAKETAFLCETAGTGVVSSATFYGTVPLKTMRWAREGCPNGRERTLWRMVTRAFTKPWAEGDVDLDLIYHETRWALTCDYRRPTVEEAARRWGWDPERVRQCFTRVGFGVKSRPPPVQPWGQP